jgi:hypothetical protein
MKPSPRRDAPKAAATSRPIEGFSVMINLIGINNFCDLRDYFALFAFK